MKMSGGPNTVRIKIALLVIALAIGVGTLYYTNELVHDLQKRERQIVQFFAKGLEHVANSTDMNSDITFLLENIIKPIDFPVILTDSENRINMESPADIKNVKIDTTMPKEKLKLFLEDMVKEMDATNNPILVKYITETADTLILTKIHYGDSELITKLKYFPYVQIIIAAIFIVTGYIGFSQIKKSEQSNIWVGMAKETAHQFGTPLSSLMGWIELLKLDYNDPVKVQDITEEIENDVEKLNKITNRFSKIGSKPEFTEQNLHEVTTQITEYFTRRLPQSGKKVSLELTGSTEAVAKINKDLFIWVLENLIKNSLDAIEQPNGKIRISIEDHKHEVIIEVSDNGKGIGLKNRQDVFRPGYSTKRRGWGLGLSLAKRIIEVYHKGKILVKFSAPGEGTVFRIVLNK